MDCGRNSIAWWMPPSSRPGTGRSRAAVAPDRQHDGVVAVAQLPPVSVAADVDAGAEDRALAAHLVQAPVEVLLLHLELGDAVAQQAADLVGPLVDRDRVAGPGQLLGGGEAGRARSRSRRPSCPRATPAAAGRTQPDSQARSMIADLDVLDRHRVLVDAEHAGGLARRRAQPAGELREVVGRVQPLDRAVPVVAPDQVVPLRDDVARAGSPGGRTGCRSPCSGRPAR